MALTLGRWIAIALTGFALTPVVILSDANPPGWQPSERDRLVERNRVAETNLRRAADHLRTMRLRDSLARVATSGSVPFQIGAGFDRVSRALIESLVADARADRALAAKIPATVFFVLDTVTEVAGHPRAVGSRGALAIDYVLPDDSSRHCIVIARVRSSTTRRLYEAELRNRISRERLLGPCAYFEHFGAPGDSIRRWLDERGWQFAQRSSWNTAPAPWLDGIPDSSYRSRIDLAYVMGSSGRACAGGRDEACAEAVLTRVMLDDRHTSPKLRAGVLSPGLYNPFVHGDNGWLTRSWPLGEREWTLLSDMVRSLGAERFERFWASDLPPDRAFQAASGVPLPTWTREWIETTYHPQATGPALPAGATGFAALMLVVALGFAIGAARRRQMA
jgi:hypothetical protein